MYLGSHVLGRAWFLLRSGSLESIYESIEDKGWLSYQGNEVPEGTGDSYGAGVGEECLDKDKNLNVL